MTDVYESATDRTGRFGAVFERGDETAFFCLLDMRKPERERIVSSFNASVAVDRAGDRPAAVRWSRANDTVGLFLGVELSVIYELKATVPVGRWADDDDAARFASR